MLLEYTIVWLLAYTLIAYVASKRLDLPDNTRITGPILSVRSQKGVAFIDYLSKKFSSLWRVWGNLGVVSAVVTAVVGLSLVLISVYGIATRPDAAGIRGPTDLVVIPGVNRFLPVDATPEIILGLVIAMIVHEGGHAIYCRTGDIGIKSTGVIFGALIPIGAFVEPDEDEETDANIPSQLRMYSAGITNNYALYFITILMFFVLCSLFVTPISGAAIGFVNPDSPADSAGIEEGQIINSVNNATVNDSDEFLDFIDNKEIDTIKTHSGESYDIPDGVFVSSVPSMLRIDPGFTLKSINNQSVRKPQDIGEILSNTEENEVSINNASEKIRVGVYVTAKENRGLAKSMNLQTGDTAIIHSIGNQRVYDNESFLRALSSQQSLEVEYWTGNQTKTTEHSFSEDNLNSVILSDSISGIGVSRLGIGYFPKDNYYNLVTFGDGLVETGQNMLSSLLLPIGSVAPSIQFGFPGFTNFVQNFYTVNGGKIFTGLIFFVASVLFWTAWINFNLAIFNCIPTFALDGGHILRAVSEASIGRLTTDKITSLLVLLIKSLVLLPLLLLFVLPLIS